MFGSFDESEKDRMKENDARLDAIEWCMDICERIIYLGFQRKYA